MKLVAYLADLFPSMPDAHLATVATTQGLLCTLLDTAGQAGDSTTPQLSGRERVDGAAHQYKSACRKAQGRDGTPGSGPVSPFCLLSKEGG